MLAPTRTAGFAATLNKPAKTSQPPRQPRQAAVKLKQLAACAATKGAQAESHSRAATVHAITFQSGDRVVVVQAPKGANIYRAADTAGLNLPASCRQGSCTSCAAKVTRGVVSYERQPECLTPKLKASGYVALCCAQVVGDVTILTHQGAKLRAERAEEMDRMKHPH
ncbi:Ferredoxin-1 [Tetrabaena socialis]|uniref:Ferredoxin-1 n=1 Tax=Tetrabaena socialis TaxID=47790 RepID=A0A2J8AD08_9CHLO|nr:Ferredoxin-1 [Tetrabaena socialis]|eukprot:PNH10400.1 Ferredoxin-1 [Tetrabaena socialis]